MDLQNDVIPVSELKSRMKQVLAHVMKTGDPVLVTQKGRSAVLIVDIGSFQKQQQKLQILEAIAKGEREILEGKTVSHAEVTRSVSSWTAVEK
jgi:prevent-host-death family protein